MFTVLNVIKKDFVKLVLSNSISSEPRKCSHNSGSDPEELAKEDQVPRKLKPSVLRT